ncbi:MAG: T9SS type A sorting domain-containing protein [Chitinophagaceae bacterium]
MKLLLSIFIFVLGISFGSFAQSPSALNIEQAAKVIKYYPNPAISFINFEFQKGIEKDYSFQIYNFLGKKVIDLKSITQKINIPLTDFYRGLYIYQLRDRAGKIIESGKFQVNN